MFRKHRKLFIFVIAFFVITVGASYLYKAGLIYNSPIVLPVIFPTPVPKTNDFVNQKYGFEFTYPHSWKLDYWDLQEEANLTTVPEGSIRFQAEAGNGTDNFEVLIWENRSNLEASDWVSEFLHEEIDRSKVPSEFNATISGIPAIRFISESSARKKPLEYIFFKKDSAIYELIFEYQNTDFDSQNSSLAEYQGIIASFNMLKDITPTTYITE